MEFSFFLLCLTILVVATSAATVSKREDKKDTVSKYKLKVKDGDKEIDEEVEVDAEKQTEKVHIPKMESGNAGEVDVVYDFKKNLTIHRLSSTKACFLSDSTENAPKPDDLVQAIDQNSTSSAKNVTDSNYKVVSIVTDRSSLSDEIASLCAELPIYLVKKTTSTRMKRWPYCRCCYYHCYYCYDEWGNCYPCCCWICYTYYCGYYSGSQESIPL